LIERYCRSEMKEIWSLHNKFSRWLQLEIYACEAWSELGVIPEAAVEKIKNNATFSVDRIAEIEEETRHDVVAFTRCVSETLGEESRYVHYGLTSSDVVDTALSVCLQEAASVIEKGLELLENKLREKAMKHKNTVIMGRTHGVHAEPTSLGLKFALWMAELQRNRERFARAKEGVRYGKISGAVGNYAHIDPFVEEYVCSRLGLKVDPVSTQIIQRDRHAEFIFVLSLVSALLEKIALEIRNLQRTETREIEEPFDSGQKGSSAMPHKRNPIHCERICGLSRIVRSHVQVSLENIPLWHERDISHSSAERVVLPDISMLVDYMLHQIIRIVDNLFVYPENMAENIQKTRGLVFSQRVMLALVDKGLNREDAYDMVQEAVKETWETGQMFDQVLVQKELVHKYLSDEELEECFDPGYYLHRVDYIYRRVGIE